MMGVVSSTALALAIALLLGRVAGHGYREERGGKVDIYRENESKHWQ